MKPILFAMTLLYVFYSNKMEYVIFKTLIYMYIFFSFSEQLGTRDAKLVNELYSVYNLDKLHVSVANIQPQ